MPRNFTIIDGVTRSGEGRNLFQIAWSVKILSRRQPQALPQDNEIIAPQTLPELQIGGAHHSRTGGYYSVLEWSISYAMPSANDRDWAIC